MTEPYLKIFRKRIPLVGGFDISAIPAIFILDLVGQATAALGAEIPISYRNPKQQTKMRKEEIFDMEAKKNFAVSKRGLHHQR